MKRLKWMPSCFVGTALLFGCSTAQINDYQRQGFWKTERAFGTSSLTASRRMVIFKLNDGDKNETKGNPRSPLRICAEPPPTVGKELSKALSQALSASVDSEKKNCRRHRVVCQLVENKFKTT